MYYTTSAEWKQEDALYFSRKNDNTTFRFLAGQQAPELPDLGAGPGRFCSADSEPEDHRAGGSAQPCDCCGRILRRDAVCLVQNEIPQYSSWVGITASQNNNRCLLLPFKAL